MSLWPQKALLKETALHVEKDCLEYEPKSPKRRWRLALAVISFIRACLPMKALMKKAGLLRSLSSVTLNVDNEPPPFLDVDPKSLGDMVREKKHESLARIPSLRRSNHSDKSEVKTYSPEKIFQRYNLFVTTSCHQLGEIN
ncbi:hypothetical protein TIFTF001_044107 [Ficus carica]|uniref:Uncharacterized protein n=2 Tax=Ficus carica TaxID=3494 RepID=A0AA87Z9U3_FICCA|nr:hypothetical protein TIFTF001_044107 [Ficus carica]